MLSVAPPMNSQSGAAARSDKVSAQSEAIEGCARFALWTDLVLASGASGYGGAPWELRATITVEEMASILGVGRSAAYEAVRKQELPSLRIGRRLLVPVPRLLALLGAIDSPMAS